MSLGAWDASVTLPKSLEVIAGELTNEKRRNIYS